MPLSIDQRRPDLAAQIEAAYNRARRLPGVMGGVALDSAVESAFKEHDDTLDTIGDPDVRAELETTVDQTNRLFGRVDVSVPKLHEFREAGVDFVDLELRFSELREQGCDPQIVIAPMLSLDDWRDIYRNLQNDPGVNDNGRIKSAGLYVADFIADNWVDLNGWVGPHIVEAQRPNGLIDRWTIGVVAGTDYPTLNNARYGEIDIAGVGWAPPICQYLTLQAARLQEHASPVDTASYAWVGAPATNPTGELVAARGSWNDHTGMLALYVRDTHSRPDTAQGSRAACML